MLANSCGGAQIKQYNLISASFRKQIPCFFHWKEVTFSSTCDLCLRQGHCFLVGQCFHFFHSFSVTKTFFFSSSCRLKEERESCLSNEDAVLVFSYLS